MPSVTLHHAGQLIKQSVGEFQPLQEVLTTFCEANGLDPAQHRFEHHRLGVVNLNQPFRLSALETNAQLELVKTTASTAATGAAPAASAPATTAAAAGAKAKGAPVKVAIQIGATRVHAAVTSDATLFETLQAAEAQNADAKLNLTRAADAKSGAYQVPTCHVQRRDFTTLQALCGNTLAKIGLSSGSVLIRCELKTAADGMSVEQAHAAVAAVAEDKKKAAAERDRLRAEKDAEMAEREKQNAAIRSKHLDRKVSASASASASTASAASTAAVATVVASPKASAAATAVSATEPAAANKQKSAADVAALQARAAIGDLGAAAKLAEATGASAAMEDDGEAADAVGDVEDDGDNSELRPKLNAVLIQLRNETAAAAAAQASGSSGGGAAASNERTLATSLLSTATATLALIVRNIAKSKPSDLRVRSLNVNRKPPATPSAAAPPGGAATAAPAAAPSLYDRIGQFPAAVRFLRLIGFTDDPITASAAAHERRLVLAAADEDEYRITLATECLDKLSSLIVTSPTSVFDGPAAGAGAAAGGPVRTEQMPDLNPTYDISQVRAALLQLKGELKDDAQFLPALYLLRSVTTDAASADAKQRVIGTDNQFVAKQIAPFKGGVAYLTFLGFVPSTAPAAAGAGAATAWTIPQYDRMRVERAAAILKRVIAENTVAESSQPVERKFKVFDPATVTDASNLAPSNASAAASSASAASALASGSATAAFPSFPSYSYRSEEAADTALVMAAAAAERKKMETLYPKDAFMTKTKREELKNASRRRYPYTTVRVQFDDALVQANFAPAEPVGALLGLLRDRLAASVRGDPFYLRIPPQLKVTAQDSTKTFNELGLVPGCLLYFCWQSGNKPVGALDAATRALVQPFVDDGLPQPLNLEQLDAQKAKDDAEAKRVADDKKRTAARAGGGGGGAAGTGGAAGKKPSWLRR